MLSVVSMAHSVLWLAEISVMSSLGYGKAANVPSHHPARRACTDTEHSPLPSIDHQPPHHTPAAVHLGVEAIRAVPCRPIQLQCLSDVLYCHP